MSMCAKKSASMLTRCATVFLFLVALAGACVAEPFRDGDTVVFFGDFITHGGLYHKCIVDFYRTRFPERKIRFVNSGIGGDTAAGAMKRVPGAYRVRLDCHRYAKQSSAELIAEGIFGEGPQWR